MGRFIQDSDLVTVRNRNNGTTFYELKESHVFRAFAQDQTKKVAFSELHELMYSPGGEYLLRHLLVVEDENARKELGLEVEPEYTYGNKEIRDILFNGSIEQMEDFLNFAPDGAIQIAKDIAIDEALPDVRKRNMLSKKTQFDINKAIELKSMMAASDEEETPQEEQKVRKAGTPLRKASTPSYKVTSMGE